MSALPAGGPVTYEVNLDVDAAIATEYLAWLEAHVDELLALPGFVGATVHAVREPVAAGRAAFCVHYRLRDMAALEAYLAGHAPRMRAAGIERFGDSFNASRRILVSPPPSATA